jgi:spore maturation protein CgeB
VRRLIPPGATVVELGCAGAGAFQFVDWRPGIDQLFKDGQELVTFRNIADLKKKIDYWLPRESERHKIGMAGMQRAFSEHTYQHRLELLLNTLVGKAQGFPTPAKYYPNYER